MHSAFVRDHVARAFGDDLCDAILAHASRPCQVCWRVCVADPSFAPGHFCGRACYEHV